MSDKLVPACLEHKVVSGIEIGVHLDVLQGIIRLISCRVIVLVLHVNLNVHSRAADTCRLEAITELILDRLERWSVVCHARLLFEAAQKIVRVRHFDRRSLLGKFGYIWLSNCY